jgi:hypothetical protein
MPLFLQWERLERGLPLTLAQQMHEQETVGRVRAICGELRMNRQWNLDEICI